ncbi:MAG: hypothetical protein U1E27_11140, partial [Kiritimatiellia bacterium]|nr:hypothetical protein [Kiritimatiellia bacterium]
SEVTLDILEDGGAVPGRPAMRMDVNVDHLVDGGGESGKYPVGWPRIRRAFKPGEVSLGDYDFLTFQVRIDSNRDEVADDVTPFIVNFLSHEGSKLDRHLDLGDVQRDWVPVRIALADIREETPGGPDAMRTLNGLQLVIAESHYAHGTFLRFDFDSVEFVRLNVPVLSRVQCANAILTPARWMTVSAGYLGAAAARERGCRIEASLIDSAGKTVSSVTVPLSESEEFRLATDGVTPGEYRLSVSIVDRDGQTLSEHSRRLIALQGPF